MSPAGFHFLRPLWLLALAPLALLLWRLARRRLWGGRWAAVCDPELLPHLLVEGDVVRRRWALPALGLAGLLAVLALAGPVWQRLPQPAFRDRSGLVIVLDLSPAMDAGDLKPSRLERARFKIADLLKARREGQTALVVYAGSAFTVTPLTTDVHTIDSQLGALGTDLMPSSGRRADLALDRAAALLHQGGLRRGDVLLLTSGVDLSQAEAAARRLRQAGYRLSVLGVGTPQGAPVPLPGGGFLQGAGGQIALSALSESDLQRLATAGGGIYRRLGADDGDLHALLGIFNHRLPTEAGEKAQVTLDTWREEGPWLLLPLLLLAPLAFRRGVLTLVFVLLVLPAPARAFDWPGLWTRPDQQASRQLARGEGTPEAGVFRDPAWRAAALYRAGRYQKALQALDGQSGERASYNRGNALARLGRYPEAIAAYKKALELDPKDEDARYNLDLVQKEQKKQQQKQQKQGNKKSADPSADKDPKQKGKDESGKAADKDKSQASATQDNGKKQGKGKEQKASSAGDEDKTAGKGEKKQDQGKQDGRQAPDDQAGKGQSGKDRQPAAATAARGDGKQGKDGKAAAAVDPGLPPHRPDEQAQAAEQWLRQIPDDPGGLLRRKFLYQYQQGLRQ